DGSPVEARPSGLEAAPATIRFPTGQTEAITDYSGSWPIESRWWDPERVVYRTRLQVVTDSGRALLLSRERGQWYLTGRYRWPGTQEADPAHRRQTRHTGGRPSPQEADAHRQMEERRRRRWDSRTRAPPGRSWPAGSRARTALPSTGTRTAPMPRRSPAPTATGSRSGPAAPTVVTDTTVRPPMMRGRAADRGCGPRAWSGRSCTCIPSSASSTGPPTPR